MWTIYKFTNLNWIGTENTVTLTISDCPHLSFVWFLLWIDRISSQVSNHLLAPIQLKQGVLVNTNTSIPSEHWGFVQLAVLCHNWFVICYKANILSNGATVLQSWIMFSEFTSSQQFCQNRFLISHPASFSMSDRGLWIRKNGLRSSCISGHLYEGREFLSCRLLGFFPF